ncbi:SpoIIE family protein phosphatase [Virgibacillus sp. W0181]|uniref:SpoIIE family protein phosphatase n=1 Tax=Virgibacillus sp. W0181 TaxID=3391581 RepID=UPI003F477753
MSKRKGAVKVSVYQKPKKDNVYCGDSYFYKETDNEFLCVLVDGLGSGEEAQESAEIVINIIKENIHVTVDSLIKHSNRQLFGKRGVVLGILKLDFKAQIYTYSSIGNIGIMTVTNTKKERNIPKSGYLSGYKRPFKVIRKNLEPEMTFFMFSDGVLDKELSQDYFITQNVTKVTEMYAAQSKEKRDDDTTLIAMHYEEVE